MARKVVQTYTKEKGKGKKNGKVKKKRHGCRNCLIMLLVFVAVICAAGYFTGDYFTQKYFDMHLYSCFGVLHDLTHAKAKKIVTNAYDESDYNRFNLALKDQLFLKEDVDFDAETLLASFVKKSDEEATDENTADGNGTEAESEIRTADYLTQTTSALGANVNAGGIMDTLAELYTRENLNLERLRGYEASNHESDYVLRITDRMLAAAANKALDEMADNFASVRKMLDEYDIENLYDVARIEQIIFGESAGTLNGAPTSVKTVKATVSLDIRKVAGTMLKKTTGQNLNFLLKLFLPKRFYVTVVIPVQEGAAVENNLYLNNMTDKKMNRAYKLIASVTALTGNSMDVKEKVASTLGKTTGAIAKVNDILALDEARDHAVSLDVFETVIDLSKLNEQDGELKPADKQLHAPDIIQTLSGIVASDAEDAVKQEYDYKHQWKVAATGAVVYDKTLNPAEAADGKEWQDYRQLFMEELAEKYMLALEIEQENGTKKEVTFDDLMRLFGLGGQNDEKTDLELLDLFDASKLGDLLENPEKNVRVDSRMLGAILQSQINNLIDGAGSLGTYNPVLEYVYTYIVTENDVKHNMLEAAISIETSNLLPDSNGVASIVTGLIGEKAVVTFNVDITPGGDDFSYIAGTLSYNGLTKEKTDTILKTIACFVSDFDTAALLAQVETPIRDTIGKMSDVIPVTLCSSKIDGAATAANALPPAIELPTVFETVKEMLFADDDDINGTVNKDITAQGIEDVLREINAVNDPAFDCVGDDAVSVDADGNATYADSFNEILEKYYIDNVGEDGGAKYTQFDDLFGEGKVADAANFDADNFRFDALYHDARPIAAENGQDDLRPVFSDNDLAALLIDKMQANEQKLYDDLLNVKGLRITVGTTERTVTLIIELDVTKLMSGENVKGQARLLPADKAFLVATVNLDKVGYYNKSGDGKTVYWHIDEVPEGELTKFSAFYDTKLTLNEMDENTYATTLLMMKSLSSSTEGALDLAARARDIGSVIKEQIETLESSLGGNIEFVQGGVRLVSVYDFIKTALGSTADVEDIRAALQGLAAYDGTLSVNSEHNYKASDIAVNDVGGALALTSTAARVTDKAFGGALAHGITVSGIAVPNSALLAKNGGPFELAQLNILHHGLGARTDWLNGFGSAYLNGADNKTFVEFTFSTSLKEILSSTATDNKLASAVPDEIYVTIVAEKTATGYDEKFYRINGLSETVQNVLLQLVKVDMAQIEAQIAKCSTALDGYAGATFYTVTPYVAGGAFGEIEFTVRM